MIKKLQKKFFSWLFDGIQNSSEFNEFLDKKILNFYKNDTLHHYRIWGDSTRLKVGKNVHLNNSMINTVSGDIVINDFTFLGHNVSLLTGSHDIKQKNIKRQDFVPTQGRDIIIGQGVWIASNATIYGPCTIGDNAVIGAGAVVTGNIKANTLYATQLATKIKDFI